MDHRWIVIKKKLYIYYRMKKKTLNKRNRVLLR
jgi:hypothetical protein